jgi:hypothetical protein
VAVLQSRDTDFIRFPVLCASDQGEYYTFVQQTHKFNRRPMQQVAADDEENEENIFTDQREK